MGLTRRGLLTGLPLAAFAGIAAALGLGRSQDGVEPVGAIDHPMPAFTLPPLPGTTAGLSSADLQGQVAIVNVWAAWCVSCRQEHPLLVSLAPTSPAPIFGIDIRDQPGAGKLYLAQHGNPFAGTGDDRDGRVGRAFGITGVPETFVVDASGQLRYRHIGPLTPDVWRDVILPLVTQLKEPA